jgi:hypothetical protein
VPRAIAVSQPRGRFCAERQRHPKIAKIERRIVESNAVVLLVADDPMTKGSLSCCDTELKIAGAHGKRIL